MANLSDTIRHISFFSGLSREDLARIAGKLEEERFSLGGVIVKQGEVGDSLYVVQSGAVEVVLENDGVGVESLAVLGPNESFGEMALFTGEQRSATVRALVDSVVLKLSKENWEELLAKHPSLSFHFCQVLSRRLAETNKDISKGRGAFNLVMEEFFSAQSAQVRDFLIRTSVLKSLEPGAIQSVLSVSDPNKLLATLSSNYPMFLRTDSQSRYEYRDYLRDFLSAKFEQTVGQEEREELHRRFGAYFSSRSGWLFAIYHYSQAPAWKEALELIKAHGKGLVKRESAKEILSVLKAIPDRVARPHGYLARLRAEVCVRLGDLDAAIRSYQDFLAHKQVSAAEAIEMARCYQELAELHQRKGEIAQALGCLRLSASMVEENRFDSEALQAMHFIEALQQRKGISQAALTWGSKALNVAEKTGAGPRLRLFSQYRKWLGLFFALGVGWIIWQMEPLPPLDQRGVHFLATLTAAVVMWMFEVFDEYVTALLLLLSWLLFDIVPAEMALGGFSESSWFFFLGVLGIAAAVTRSGLLYRVALQVLCRFRPNYKNYTFLLGLSGLLLSPMLPNITGRVAIMAPTSLAISESMGFKPRSSGSAGLVLSAFVGFSQVSFTFLTGATACLFAWNLLPDPAKSEFGWTRWAIAAFPAGIFTLFLLIGAVQFLFRAEEQDQPKLSPKTLKAQLEILGPLTGGERLGLALMVLLLLGWISKPLHGISEAWITLGTFAAFLVTGVLDKKGLRNNVDWGFLLFFGVVSALTEIVPHLKLDGLLVQFFNPILSMVSFNPLPFLIVVLLIVYLVRLFLSRYPALVLLTLGLVPLAQGAGIHPGVLLLTILIAIDSWFLLYQTEYYQIAYYSTDEKAFSHSQARKLMVAKFFVSFLAVAISVPYWRILGLIQ